MSKETLHEMKKFIQITEGTWALPEQESDYKALASLLFGRGEKLSPADMKDNIYHIYGDDDLFDMLEKLEDENPNLDARPYVIDWLKQHDPLTYKNLYSQGEAQQVSEDFGDKVAKKFHKAMTWNKDSSPGGPEGMKKRVRNMSDQELQNLAKGAGEPEGARGSARGLQMRLIKQELKRRYGIKPGKDVAEQHKKLMKGEPIGENVESRVLKAVISPEEREIVSSHLNQGGFRGTDVGFESQDGDLVVVFDTHNPAALAQELESVIDAGETSWAEIFDLHEEGLTEADDDAPEQFFVAIGNGNEYAVIGLEKDGSYWHESTVMGDELYGMGGKRYMSYLSREDIIHWLNRDYDQVSEPFDNEWDAEIEMDRMREDEDDLVDEYDSIPMESISLNDVTKELLGEGAYEDYLRKTDPLGGFGLGLDDDDDEKEPATNICPSCEGEGCEECHGEGEIFESDDDDEDKMVDIEDIEDYEDDSFDFDELGINIDLEDY